MGALKVRGIRIARSSTYRCNGHGGGALGTQMNLFDRFARVVKVIFGNTFFYRHVWEYISLYFLV